MTRFLRCATLVLAVLGVADSCPAQFSLDVIKRGKEATVLVEAEDGEGGVGTAFCIDPGGLFVTNAHVVEMGSKHKLIVNPSLPSQAVYHPRILSVDPKLDLALLQVTSDHMFTALELGREDELVETQEVVAFGYPFGKFLSGGKGYPSVSVNTGRITSLRMSEGKLSSIQLDVELNPGNSGGPVLDKSGRVIGIVQKGVKGARINFAVPVGRLSEMLTTPLVLLDPAPIAFRDRHKPVDWTIKVLTGGKPDRESDVGLTVALGASNSRLVPLSRDAQQQGVYRAHFVPVSSEGAAPIQTLGISATFAGGQVNGRMADRAITVGAKEVRLSQLTQVRLRPPAGATLSAGGEVAGGATGLADVALDLGGASVSVDLGKAERIEIQPPPAEALTLRYVVSVRKGAKEVASIEKTVEIGDADGRSGSPGAGGSLAIKPPPMTADKQVVKLPATVTDIAVGGGGRFLLLTLKSVRKLAVFDVNTAKVVRLISLPTDDALVAAGASKFVVVSPSNAVIQRWSLANLEKERTVVLKLDATFTTLAMGSRSSGPIMFFCVRESGPVGSAGFGFLDLEKLAPITLQHSTSYFMGNRQGANAGSTFLLNSPHFGSSNERVQLRASPDGELFAAWSTTHGPRGMLSFVWGSRGNIEMHYEHNDVGHILPGGDGRTLYTGTGGVFDADLKRSRTSAPANGFFVPSTDPNYYVGLDKQRASIYVTGSGSPLLVVPGLSELNDPQQQARNWSTQAITDKRIAFIPQADLLVTIPVDQDQIVLRHLNIMDSLRKSDIDYLFVSSIPVRKATRGMPYDYQLVVQSRRAGVKYELTSGPDGMKVSPTGRITWDVPGDVEGQDVTVVVTVKDSSNQEIFHNFTIELK
jgi:S1-C subfamily serine protease